MVPGCQQYRGTEMLETVVAVLLTAVIGGLGFLAYRHSDAYRRLYRWLMTLPAALLFSSLLMPWLNHLTLVGELEAQLEARSEVPADAAAEQKAVAKLDAQRVEGLRAAITFNALVFLVALALGGFLLLLLNFPQMGIQPKPDLRGIG